LDHDIDHSWQTAQAAVKEDFRILVIKGHLRFKPIQIRLEGPAVLAQEKMIRDRMSKRVEDFVYSLLVNVFNAEGTGTIGKDLLLAAGMFPWRPSAHPPHYRLPRG